jgi:hypothetical protein
MDGVEPVSLVTDERRQMFLETSDAFSNEMAFRDEDGEDEDFHILMPHDLGYFIEYADVKKRAEIVPGSISMF